MRVSLLFSLFAATSLWAAPADIDDVYRSIDSDKNAARRLEHYSNLLLGRKYKLDPLGEGKSGRFDRDPLYRFDAFDCTTFVETVTALSIAKKRNEFSDTLQKIRYMDSKKRYTHRNHFISLEWLPNNIKKGIYQDVTREVFPKEATLHQIKINKRKWYESKQIKSVQGFSSKIDQAKTHKKLNALGKEFGSIKGNLYYVPTNKFIRRSEFGFSLYPRMAQKIPHLTFFNLVMNWKNAGKKVGTNLAVWHQGMFVRKKGKLFVRHAFRRTRKVHDMPAEDFFIYFELLKRIDVDLIDVGVNLFSLAEKRG